MRELLKAIPDVSLLLTLTPEELGAKMLLLMRKRGNNMFELMSLELELWSQFGNETQYPLQKRAEIELALSEAWAWLTAQGLIVPAPGENGRNGWRVLSRRAQTMETETDFANFKVGRLLPKELLNHRIADPVWGAFMRGEFDVAAFQAMKGVEVAVRSAAALGQDLLGVKFDARGLCAGERNFDGHDN